MSNLEDEIVKILSKHASGLGVENIETELQNQCAGQKNPMPQWVISFALGSLWVKGLATQRGFFGACESGRVLVLNLQLDAVGYPAKVKMNLQGELPD